ncbi:hypothetical protein NPIL_655681 [Nephila pilipes]|uniref:Uncharacterized protein n=1 Tax=Nephila pilipes TaxID=299642 RepID=A0A8X6M7Y5_NEPPI|nr:hypothetical protein NPIL_655681 [Nephila pilipes]
MPALMAEACQGAPGWLECLVTRFQFSLPGVPRRSVRAVAVVTQIECARTPANLRKKKDQWSHERSRLVTPERD